MRKKNAPSKLVPGNPNALYGITLRPANEEATAPDAPCDPCAPTLCCCCCCCVIAIRLEERALIATSRSVDPLASLLIVANFKNEQFAAKAMLGVVQKTRRQETTTRAAAADHHSNTLTTCIVSLPRALSNIVLHRRRR